MIPVAANHSADIVDRYLLPWLWSNVLPTGNLFENKKTDLVTAIQKMSGLRVMRGANDIAVHPLTQDLRILTLHASGHRLPDERKGLVAVKAAQLDDLAVEREALVSEHRLTEANATSIFVDHLAGANQPYMNTVK